MSERAGDTINFGMVIAAILVALFLSYRWYAKRPAGIDPLPSEVHVTPAPAGGVMILTTKYTKLRDECLIEPVASDTYLRDSSGNTFMINQRSGLRTYMRKGEWPLEIYLEVPRFAQPGSGVVWFETTYLCNDFWRTHSTTPEYPVQILEE